MQTLLVHARAIFVFNTLKCGKHKIDLALGYFFFTCQQKNVSETGCFLEEAFRPKMVAVDLLNTFPVIVAESFGYASSVAANSPVFSAHCLLVLEEING